MKYGARIAVIVLAATSFRSAFAQSSTWCGKHYMRNQTVVSPGGQFRLPVSSDEPLVAFRCSPAFRPYLGEDAKDAAFIVDTPIVYQFIQGASHVSLPSSSERGDIGTMDVTISIDNHVFAKHVVPLNTSGYEIPVDLSSLSTQRTGYSVTCDATYRARMPSSTTQYFSASTSLLYLPDTNNSVAKTDLRTGVLWARPPDGKGGNFQPFIPQGFYLSFDQHLAKNLSLIDQLKADGFNTIHPIPPYDNMTLVEHVLSRTTELGLYLVYDMRSSYQNLTSVAQQVDAYRSLPNLLLWETAHEPDGNSDPFDAARSAYDLIYEMDGYHPVSIVLNCQDYNFAPYVEGADIVLEDAYPVGINATLSPIWHTECTPDFGHCGCDNCQGSIDDIATRIQTFKDRLNILGYDRTKTVWTTPQAIGSGAYWSTTPTGQQWAAMGMTSFNHGATGSISFQYPTTTGNASTIEGTAMTFTKIVANYIQPFLVDPEVTHAAFNVDGVDAGLWHHGPAYLLLVANLGMPEREVFVPWTEVGLGSLMDLTQIQQIFPAGPPTATTDATGLTLGAGAIGVYTVSPPAVYR